MRVASVDWRQQSIETAHRGSTLRRALILGFAFYLFTLPGFVRNMPPATFVFQGVVFAALLAWSVLRLIRRTGVPHTPITWPLLLYAGSMVLSAAFSVAPRLSLDGVLTTMALIGLFFLLCDLLLSGWDVGSLELGLLAFAGLLLLQALWVTYEWYAGWLAVRVPGYPLFPIRFRIFGVADWPTQLAGVVNLALPFAILRLAQARTALARIVWLVWLVGAVLVLYFASSRSGWLASLAVVGLTLGWLLLRNGLPKRRRFGLWLRDKRSLLAGLAFILLFVILYLVIPRLSPSQFSANAGGRFAARDVFWRVGWQNFLAHPLTGSGPLTYGGIYLEQVPADPRDGWIAPHAHNLILNTLGEQGVLGFAALLALAGALAVSMVRAFLSRSGTAGTANGGRPRDLLVAAFASLAGYFVQYQFDVLAWLPTSSAAALIVCALALSDSGRLARGPAPSRRVLAGSVIACLILGGLLVPANLANQAMMDGVWQADGGDWQAAARSLDRASALDPQFRFYKDQRGYAYGVLAAQHKPAEEGLLAQAIESYAAALKTAPQWTPNAVNAAWLLLQSGDTVQAEALLAGAASQIDAGPAAALLLGKRYAQSGRTGAAREAYRAALVAHPWARSTVICLSQDLCKEVAASPAELRPGPDEVTHAAAVELLHAGKPEEALTTLAAVPFASSSPLPWLDRANAHLVLDQTMEARYAVLVADNLQAVNQPEAAAYFITTLARLRSRQGDTAAAIRALETLARPELLVTPYAKTVYRRIGLPGLYLPPVDLLLRTRDDLEALTMLAGLYAEQGRSEEADWARARANTLKGLLVTENGS